MGRRMSTCTRHVLHPCSTPTSRSIAPAAGPPTALSSDLAAQPVAEGVAISSAQRELRTGREDNDVLSAEHGLQLAHAREIHDGRAMNAREVARVELALERLDRLAHEIATARRV